MANQLSTEAKRVASIVDEIEGYYHTISYLEYQICDVPESEREGDIEDLKDGQKRLQNTVNTMKNDLEFDDNVKIEYDGKLTQVYRNGDLWLECRSGDDGFDWIEHAPVQLFPAIGASQLTLIEE